MSRALKRRLRAERADRPDIVTFVTDPRYLGRAIGARLSVAQRTLLKGCYGQAEELEVWQEATQRAYPAREFLEVTVVAGNRAGKDSRFLAPVRLYEAIYGGFVVNVGETAVVVCVAPGTGISGPDPLPARTVEPSVPVPSPDPLPVRPTTTAML